MGSDSDSLYRINTSLLLTGREGLELRTRGKIRGSGGSI